RISLNRLVELCATNPAKLFGLYPRKGTIAVGSDADIVVFDPTKRHTISAATQHSKSDYNLYEGTTVTGSPEVVLLRGKVLVDGDELVAQPGVGRFIPRARFGEQLTAGVAVAWRRACAPTGPRSTTRLPSAPRTRPCSVRSGASARRASPSTSAAGRVATPSRCSSAGGACSRSTPSPRRSSGCAPGQATSRGWRRGSHRS